MASISRRFIQLPSDPDLLLHCIDGAESDDSGSDFDSYIDKKEPLKDLLKSHLLDDKLARLTSESFVPQSNSSAPPSAKGSSFLAPPRLTGKMIYTLTK